MAVMAMVFAATIIPFVPIEVPPAATACQLWADVPDTHVAARIPAVGTIQLISPTSVEPPVPLVLTVNGSILVLDELISSLTWMQAVGKRLRKDVQSNVALRLDDLDHK